MDLSHWITSGIAFIALLGGGLGFLSTSRKDGIIKVLTQDNVATKNYNKTLESELAKVTAERDSYRTQSDNFKQLAQRTPELEALTKAIDNQTQVITRYFSNLTN